MADTDLNLNGNVIPTDQTSADSPEISQGQSDVIVAANAEGAENPTIANVGGAEDVAPTNVEEGIVDAATMEELINQASQEVVEETTPDLSGVEITEDDIINSEIPQSIEGELDNSKLVGVSFDEGGGMGGQNHDVFLGDTGNVKKKNDDEGSKMGGYLRGLFTSIVFLILGIIGILVFVSFNKYISLASQPVIEYKDQEFVNKYKEAFTKVKGLLGKDNKNNYNNLNADNLESITSNITKVINADDIDYIDKKDLLAPFISELVSTSEGNVTKIDEIKQSIAKQGFLPEEIEVILEEDGAISTIQRSLNALEIIKFSTAANVFSYMNTALSTISEMMRIGGVSVEKISQLLITVASRGEKDLSAYVNLCYLNPFENSASCDTIDDLKKYYTDILKDKTIDLDLFKNVMYAIDQLLENKDTALFAITFNGFNAQDKDITFNIEVYTNQNDEKVLIAQGKKNPNIFILSNIINLLKQSSFVIGAEINTKTVDVETKSITMGGITSTVHYSSQDFSIPVQKSTEREIFDYIDLDSVMKLVDSKK